MEASVEEFEASKPHTIGVFRLRVQGQICLFYVQRDQVEVVPESEAKELINGGIRERIKPS